MLATHVLRPHGGRSVYLCRYVCHGSFNLKYLILPGQELHGQKLSQGNIFLKSAVRSLPTIFSSPRKELHTRQREVAATPRTRSLLLPRIEATTLQKHNTQAEELWNAIRYISASRYRLLTCHQKDDRNGEGYSWPADKQKCVAQSKARGRQDL